MSDKSSTKQTKLPIHFQWGNRLLLWVFFTLYLFVAGFPTDLQPQLILGISAYAFLILVFSFSDWINKPILLQLILLVDAFIFGFISTYTGLGISSVAIVAALLIVWLISPGITSLFYLLALFVGASILSFYYSQIIDFSIWGLEQQLAIVMGSLLAIIGLSQMRRDLGSTRTS